MGRLAGVVCRIDIGDAQWFLGGDLNDCFDVRGHGMIDVRRSIDESAWAELLRTTFVGLVACRENILARWARRAGAGQAHRRSRRMRAQCAANLIHVGAWSLALSQPRTLRSTSACLRRPASDGLSSRWSIRRPAF